MEIASAREAILRSVRQVETERAGVINAFGRTLAEDLVVEEDVPAFDTAAIEGYAVKAEETERADPDRPVIMGVLTESPSARKKRLLERTVVKVRAGDPLPEGANAVASKNAVYRPQGEAQVIILSEIKRGANVRLAGSTTAAGDVILPRGSCIGPCEMALIASVGAPGVAVSRKPKIAVVTMGAKVVDIVEDLAPGEIRNSARYGLVGMILDAGCDLGRLLHVRDGRIGLERALAECSSNDAVIVALGPGEKHDHAVQAIRGAGEVIFERLLIEPGGSTAFGPIDGKPVFICPFDAVLEAFEVLIRPALLSMIGRKEIDRRAIRAGLVSTLKLNAGCRHYIRGRIEPDRDGYRVTPLAHGKTRDGQWARVDCLIVIPEDVETIPRGELVQVLLLC